MAKTIFSGLVPGHGYREGDDEVIVLEAGQPDSHGVVLKIGNTGGHWYLSTLLESPNNQIWIDYGQRYLWTNVLEVLKEAKRHCVTCCEFRAGAPFDSKDTDAHASNI
tara:strand:- start:695 stop:1018 length:324 start_codon:yes stop_codon:yes gene_type:complete